MQSKVLHAVSAVHLEEQLAKLSDSSFFPCLAVVFMSIQQDIKAVTTLLRQRNIDVVGCTTAGEIVNEDLHEKSIAVLLMDIDPSCYHIDLAIHENESVYDAALKLGEKAVATFERPGMLIMSGGLGINAEGLINGIKAGVGREIPIYGGLAGDDMALTKTWAFAQNQITDCGISSLIIDADKIEMKGLAVSGWKPVGTLNTITKIEGNVIYTINGERAYDVFMRYFGGQENPDAKHDPLFTLQTNHPFQIIRDGYNVLRSPLLINKEQGTITLAANVPEGSQFRFSTSPGFEVIEQTIDEFDSLRQNTPEADALIMFSCKGRHGAFGPMLEDEIQGLYDYWQKPLIGFLSYGEFGNSPTGVCEFYNETCSLVLFKEK